MDNGIVNLIKRKGTPEDLINYQGFTKKIAALQALMDEQHFNYPAYIGSRSMFAAAVQFDLNFAAVTHLTQQADFYAKALAERGWGNIPGLKAVNRYFNDFILPETYNGKYVNPDLADIFFPAQEDIGKVLIVDNMSSFVVRDLDSKATVVRRTIWTDHRISIEVLADENGRFGLIDRGPSGLGYLLARCLGIEKLIQWDHAYASTAATHASLLSLEHYANQIDSIQQ